MSSSKIGAVLSACLAVTAGAAVLWAAAEQNRPGELTQAHVWVENRAADEAIPVAVQNTTTPLRVQVTGTPIVTVDPTTSVPTRVTRQSWEYRTMSVPVGQDPANVLVAPGNDGWEVVGMFQPSPTSTGLLLKRPR